VKCPFCEPDHPVIHDTPRERVIQYKDDTFILVPTEHLAPTAENVAKCKYLLDLLPAIAKQGRVTIDFNFHISVPHVHFVLVKK